MATPPKDAIVGFVIRLEALAIILFSIGPPEQTQHCGAFVTTKEEISNA